MKYFALVLCCFPFLHISAQQGSLKAQGIITGHLVDAVNNKAIASATITLSQSRDSFFRQDIVSTKEGIFLFENLAYGFYKLTISASGYTLVSIDSINLREERFDFDLNEVKLSNKTTGLPEVIIYVEKPLVENKDGKITFNVGESALSAGSTTSELLKQSPLVNVDPDGKILLMGKDVKVLIDDKPVQLDAKQLQELLESMPGSMIEKIEVMTTPPPQYANERGGVINIVTKKGKVGFNARLVVNYGTRGEAGINANIGYKKNKLAINLSAGFGYSEYLGNSFSKRQNIYTDSTNYFDTRSINSNNNRRPNARLSIDYDLDKHNLLNFTGTFNSTLGENESTNEYINRNRFREAYRISNRFVLSNSQTTIPNFQLTYTRKGRTPGEILRIISGVNLNSSSNDKHFFQQFLNPDLTQTGIDSTQLQETTVKNQSLNLIINYDRPIVQNKWSINLGTNITDLNSYNVLNTEFLKKPEGIFVGNEILSNEFTFSQDIVTFRAALRHDIKQNFHINAGLQEEFTQTNFLMAKSDGDYKNRYWSALPFFNLVKKWVNNWNLTLSYKRSIQRPGLGQLNPGIDYSDPYNSRAGNPFLKPYFSHNVDMIIGKWSKLYNVNFSAGYNELTDIYSAIRKLQTDGKTLTTWQNISGRKEYETSAWGGYTLSKKSTVNLSIGYTYNLYSLHDRTQRKFRNGGSLYTTLNGNYIFTDLFNSSASFTFNRFANPQGSVRSAISMNIGMQKKFFKKKVIFSLNMIDPFSQQQNRTQTVGSNFNIESLSYTRTRNFRFSVSYLFSKKTAMKKKPVVKRPLVSS